MRHKAERQIVVALVPEGSSLFELATPCGVWGPNRSHLSGLDIEFVPCSVDAGRSAIEGGLTVGGLSRLEDHIGRADLVVVPTWPITDRPVDTRLVDLLGEAHGAGATLVGLCLGTFAVAATGLLDGRAGTTHWRQRERFEASFPAIRFEPDTLYVDEGDIVTSAGSAAALDCCLHLLRRDHGAEAAAAVARSLVTAPHRHGTQSQYASAPPITKGADPISRALSAAAEDIESVSSVVDLVRLAGVGRRTLERHLIERIGVTPRDWLDEQRVLKACRLLESTEQSIDQIARAAGYGSTPTLRRAMRQRRAVTPTAYRAAFGGVAASTG
ncbi:MAG: helix-turn-helix domain-containing protein [Actinomycetia bacterium]|nr:helix-turn-helix domain-containing protein [Actinomycetes bacterium]